MLKQIKTLLREIWDDEDPGFRVRRNHERYRFSGARLRLEVGVSKRLFRLTDLSCGGASGLLSEPLAVGQQVRLRFDKQTAAEATVCWVRMNRAGLQFAEPLSQEFVDEFRENVC